MREMKDTARATVHVGYDGSVHKRFHGSFARERFENEVRMLKFLEERECPFVPRLIHADESKLYMVTTNCGAIVNSISEERMKALFEELETYGVRHDDPFPRNITYSPHLGRFCIIDFEFATLVESGEGLTIEQLERMAKES